MTDNSRLLSTEETSSDLQPRNLAEDFLVAATPSEYGSNFTSHERKWMMEFFSEYDQGLIELEPTGQSMTAPEAASVVKHERRIQGKTTKPRPTPKQVLVNLAKPAADPDLSLPSFLAVGKHELRLEAFVLKITAPKPAKRLAAGGDFEEGRSSSEARRRAAAAAHIERIRAARKST